jgi:hypothetical protein
MTPLSISKFGFSTLTMVDWISLTAATTNAFNGALLARRPDHYKHFTVIGVVILAYAGGIGGAQVAGEPSWVSGSNSHWHDCNWVARSGYFCYLLKQ